MATLVVEDGSGVANANAYYDLTNTTLYHADRGNTVWASGDYDDNDRIASIIKATSFLDTRYFGKWKGLPTFDTQELSWPRYGVVIDAVTISGTALPKQLLWCMCEAALVFLQGSDLQPVLERGGRIVELQEGVGPVSERTRWSEGAPAHTVHTVIQDYVRPLLQSSGLVGNIVRS